MRFDIRRGTCDEPGDDDFCVCSDLPLQNICRRPCFCGRFSKFGGLRILLRVSVGNLERFDVGNFDFRDT